MNLDPQIQMLQEMGFLRQQASEALSASGNDLNQAIAYLFGEVDASSETGTRLAPYDVNIEQPHVTETVGVSNPAEIPDFISLYSSHTPGAEVRHCERPVSDEGVEHSIKGVAIGDAEMAETAETAETALTHKDALYSSDSGSSSLDGPGATPLFEEKQAGAPYPENIKTEFTTVPCVLSRDSKLRSWVPLIMILANSSIFAKPVLQLESELRFMRELQQIVYFVQNFKASKRWYCDTDELAKVLENDGPCGSLSDEELILNIIDFLMKKEPALKAVFESMVQSLDEDISNNLTVLEIDSDARGSTLYETLNELFWQKDFELLGRIKYTSVAPIVTYQLLPADSDTPQTSFQLLEIMYPEIYSDKAIDRVREEIHAIKRAQMEYQKLNRKLMELNFFEGKKIDGFLLQAATALQENSLSASEDIRALAGMLRECRFAELDTQNEAKTHASPKRLALFEGLIDELPALRAYRLLGVIFSETKFYVRFGDLWFDMEGGVTVDFACVGAATEQRIGSNNITLVYGDVKMSEPLTIVTDEDCSSPCSDDAAGAGQEAPGKSQELTNKSTEQDNKALANDSRPEMDTDGNDTQGEVLAARNLPHNVAPFYPGRTNAKPGLGPSESGPGLTRAGVNSTDEEAIDHHMDGDTKSKDFVKRPKWEGAEKDFSAGKMEGADPANASAIVRVKRRITLLFLQRERNLPQAAP